MRKRFSKSCDVCMSKGAAQILGLTPASIRRLAQAGLLPVVLTLPDGQRIFDVPALIALAQQRQADATGAHRERPRQELHESTPVAREREPRQRRTPQVVSRQDLQERLR
jgi:hypothetical protein